jgi:hypothetical protein
MTDGLLGKIDVVPDRMYVRCETLGRDQDGCRGTTRHRSPILNPQWREEATTNAFDRFSNIEKRSKSF